MLGEKSVRLETLFCQDGLLALDKPAGLAVEPHPFWNESPDLCRALRDCAKSRPSFALCLKPSGIFHLDADISGVALFACNPEAGAHWRNLFGSRLLRFCFRLLTLRNDLKSRLSCDLPLAPHRDKPLALVTHTQGKRAATQFERLEAFGRFEIWQAYTDYLRPHQIRLHAAECGLRILGESLYGQTPEPLLSELKPGRFKKRGEEKPLYGHLCAHLQQVILPDGVSIACPLPEKWIVLEKKLRFFARNQAIGSPKIPPPTSVSPS